MKRGEIYYIKSTYREEGSEQRGDRPAVIVSNDQNNENSDVVEVVYMTTKPKTDLPTHVFIRSALSPFTLLCEQVSSVSTKRIGTLIGQLTENELQSLNTALAISLGIDFGQSERTCPADCTGIVKPVQIMGEPTREELEKLLEEMNPTQNPPKIFTPEPSADLIRLETERDLYRKFNVDLLDILKKGAQA